MLHLLGSICIIGGSTGLAFRLVQEMRQRMRGMNQMEEILALFQNEIGYSRASLPEACLSIEKRVAEPYRNALQQIRLETEQNSGAGFPDIWRDKMGAALRDVPLKKEEKEIFLSFAAGMGYSDSEMQIRVIERQKIQLAGIKERLEKSMESKAKVITSMGILGGLMLVIILL